MLSQRERILGLASGSLVGLVIVINFIVSPYLKSWQDTGRNIEDARQELSVAEQKVSRGVGALQRWDVVSQKAWATSVGTREAAFRSYLDMQSQARGLLITTGVRRRRPYKKGEVEYTESLFDLQFTSSLASPLRLLADLQSGEELVRVSALTITNQAEAPGRELEFKLTLSTIAFLEEHEPGKTSTGTDEGANPGGSSGSGSEASAASPGRGSIRSVALREADADLDIYQVILERNIFSPYPPRIELEPEPEPGQIVAAPPPIESPFVLTGVMLLGKGWVALMEDKEAGDRRVLSPGEEVAGWTIKSISLVGVGLTRADQTRSINVGETLSGIASPPPRASTTTSTTRPTSGRETSREQTFTPEMREAIRERLRAAREGFRPRRR